MYKSLFSFLFILGFGMTAIAGVPGGEVLKIDPASSNVTWIGKKVTGQHQGTIAVKEGTLEIKKGMLTGGSAVIDMTTIKVTDLQGEYAGKLEGHLKSDDFFGVGTYPLATLIILDAKSMGTNVYDVKANLTIRGTTQEIQFPVTVKPEGKKYKAEANITIDRSKFNVKYGSGAFYEDLGDKTIYDNFELKVSLVTQ